MVLAAVYVVAAFATAGRHPREARVAGVDVDGKTPAAARMVAAAAFGERLIGLARLTAGKATLDTTLARVSSRMFDPARIGHVVFGHDDIERPRSRRAGEARRHHRVVIQGGRLREDLGGGVSQLATTLYNAAFLAGLDDV